MAEITTSKITTSRITTSTIQTGQPVDAGFPPFAALRYSDGAECDWVQDVLPQQRAIA